MKLKRRLSALLLLLASVTLASDAPYSVVIKKTGKVISGKLIRQDAEQIFLEQNGVTLTFKKQALDLEKMKDLNVAVDQPQKNSGEDAQEYKTVTVENTLSPNVKNVRVLQPPPQRRDERSVVEVARELQNIRTGNVRKTYTNKDIPQSELFVAGPALPESERKLIQDEMAALEKQLSYLRKQRKELNEGDRERPLRAQIIELQTRLIIGYIKLERNHIPDHWRQLIWDIKNRRICLADRETDLRKAQAAGDQNMIGVYRKMIESSRTELNEEIATLSGYHPKTDIPRLTTVE